MIFLSFIDRERIMLRLSDSRERMHGHPVHEMALIRLLPFDRLDQDNTITAEAALHRCSAEALKEQRLLRAPILWNLKIRSARLYDKALDQWALQ
jgi:hypothetical protein